MSRKIGSLWKHKKDNLSYLTGTIEVIAGIPIRVCVFKNNKKEKDTQPDYNIVLSEKMADKKTSPKVEDLGEF